MKETRAAKEALVNKHGFEEDVFHVVQENDHVHIPHQDYYPDDWETEIAGNVAIRIKGSVKRDCIPEGLVLFVMTESQCTCCTCVADDEKLPPMFQDPIMMLKGIELWERNHGNKFK